MPSRLPSEVYEAIFSHLPALRDSDASVLTLLNCSITCSALRCAVTQSYIWKPHYQIRWVKCDKEREAERIAMHGGNYWMMYVARRRQDCAALELLADITAAKSHHVAMLQLVEQLGSDVWDIISLEANSLGRSLGDHQREYYQSDRLSRKYWAQEVLRTLTRFHAVRCCEKIASGGDISFEEGLCALSSFHGVGYDEIKHQLDSLAADCRTYLLEQQVPLTEDIKGHEVAAAAVEICNWMRIQGFDGADSTHYHHLSNNFLHKVLTTHKRTLPMSLVCVFVSIARRMGLDASPVGFPGHVIAHISVPTLREKNPTGAERAPGCIYVDVFNSRSQPLVALPELQHKLALMPDIAENWDEYLVPTQTSKMLVRAAHNIIHSVNHIPSKMYGWFGHLALYAAITAIYTQLEQPNLNYLCQLIPVMINCCPLDVLPILSRFAPPTQSHSPYYRRVQHLCDLAKLGDAPMMAPPRRTSDTKYFVGSIVQCPDDSDDNTGMYGVITAWNAHSTINGFAFEVRAPNGSVIAASQDEIVPFYAPAEPSQSWTQNIRLLEAAHPDLGYFFTRMDIDMGVADKGLRKCRFVMSKHAQLMYPEDNAESERYMSTPIQDV
ncbi:hypothetical protein BOTBODRAFT_35661 [Botryobasidium botryosum FD-172 SS1]|uniref:F-box domain-containing protein n=1 Tax=Botryobasidium botryosum (strain FD-172 SS1) TaxID=930990 RepID=A0A067M5S0_BOTB1|nr:hypothetical protein BOTBODRAFT_35661 [Botryobasidium botryosum FD-172 SS1]